VDAGTAVVRDNRALAKMSRICSILSRSAGTLAVTLTGGLRMRRLQFVDDLYADQFADRLRAARLIGGFGVLAFLVATAGIYSRLNV
jgi:hypothetical protein